jgi:hypothetical protein
MQHTAASFIFALLCCPPLSPIAKAQTTYTITASVRWPALPAAPTVVARATAQDLIVRTITCSTGVPAARLSKTHDGDGAKSGQTHTFAIGRFIPAVFSGFLADTKPARVALPSPMPITFAIDAHEAP